LQNVIVLKIEESLYFANVEQIKALLVRIEHTGSLESHPGDTLPTPPPLYVRVCLFLRPLFLAITWFRLITS
jgi:hypothetical protein